MVWGGKRYCVGGSHAEGLSPLDAFRKTLLMVHASAADQNQAIDLFLTTLQREILQGVHDTTIQNINKDLKQLFTSEAGVHGMLLGLRILIALVPVDYWTFPLKITFFYNLAKGCVPSEDQTIVALTAECISCIASASTTRDGGLITTSIIEEETRRALEWLALPTDKDGRWYSACVILDSVLKAVPETVIIRSDAQINSYWNPLWSENLRDQLSAVEVFKTTIDLVFPDDADATGVFNKLVRRVFEGLMKGSHAAALGSLMCLRELLDYSSGQFQASDYRALADSVLDSCDMQNEAIQQVALEVLAKMSRHYEDLFVTAYLEEALQKIAKLYAASSTNREPAFAALSEICSSLSPSKIQPHVRVLADYVRGAMADASLRRAALGLLGLISQSCPAVMEVELLGEDWNAFLRKGTVTDNFFDVIEVIVTSIPSLHRDLTEVSRTVVDEALRMRDGESVINALKGIERIESCRPQDIVGCKALLEEHLLPLLSYDDTTFRESAVKASLATLRSAARLIDHDPRESAKTISPPQSSFTGLTPIIPATHRPAASASTHLVFPIPRRASDTPAGNGTGTSWTPPAPTTPEVSDKHHFLIPLLTPIVDLAVVDMDATIREAVLSGLDTAEELTCVCVAQPVIDCLFMAFNDTVPEIRQLSLTCLCKLSASQNVFNGLTRICMQLAEDNPSRDEAEQTHCTQLLAHLVRAVPAVGLPMASDILQTTIDRLREPSRAMKSPKLVSSLLATLGEINDLVIGDESASKVLRDFIPYVVDCLDDRQKRLAAVQVLIKIVCTTGLVIDFYGEYPTVLPILLGFLQSKEEPLHNAVMKLIGTIGAVDPLRAKNLSFWAEVEARDGMRRRQNALKNSQTTQYTPRSSSAITDTVRRMMRHGERGAYTDILARPANPMKEVSRYSNVAMTSAIAELQAPIRSLPGLMDLLPAVALQSLLILLASPPHQSINPRAIDAIRLIIKSLSHAQLAKFCPPVLEPIMRLLKKNTSSRDIHTKLLQLLNTIVVLLKSHVEPHCEKLLTTIKDYWDGVLKEAVQQKADRRGSIPLNLQGQLTGDDAGSDGDQPASPEDVRLDASGSADLSPPIDHTPSVPVEMLLMNVIALIEEIGRVSPVAGLQDHSKWIFQCLFQSMQIDKMERMELVQKCFDAFRSLVVCVNEHLHEVLPLLLDPVNRSDVTTQVKVKALTTLHSIIEVAVISDHTARVLHYLLSIVAGNDKLSGQIVDLILRCIHQLCKSTGKLFVRFIPLTRRMLGSLLMKDPALVQTLNLLEANKVLPPDPKPHKAEKRPATEDTPKVLTCVLAMGVEAFAPDAFKRAVVNHLKIPVKCIEILRTKGPACTVDFRFVDMDHQSIMRYHHAFLKLARSTGGQTSALAHELRLHEVREKEGGACYPMQVQALQHMWNTRGKRKARDWEEWINRFSVELLKHSPSRALQACYQCGQSYLPFARDLFCYSFVACFQELDEDDKMELLANMNHALRCDLPPFVLHMILSLAEFMEEERYRSVYTAAGQSKFYKLARPSTDAKFGVGYADVKSDNSTRVTISKVQAGGPGDIARLPVGGKVLKLNNIRVKNVKQLSELLAGQTSITLEVQLPNAIQRFVTKPGPFFEIDLLADVCENKQLLAKALHYQEERFRDSVTELKKANQDDINKFAVNFIELCSTLIQLSNNLGLREGANGVLDYLKRYFQDWVKEEELTLECSEMTSFAKMAGKQIDSMLWIERRGYEKLQWWSKAIKAYKAQAQVDPNNRHRYSIGIMRCYKQLGRWEHLLYEAKRGWNKYDLQSKEEVASMAAHGAWILSAWSSLGGETIPSHWDFMESCVHHMPVLGGKAAEREFFLAILAVHKEQYKSAVDHIGRTRKLLETRLSSLVGESYARAYNVIVWLQKVQGLEEVIEYKVDTVGGTRRWEKLREVWHKRMFGMQPTVEHWQDMLGIMALVLEKDALKSSGMDADDLLLWLKFVSICRRCNRNSLAESTLLTLMGFSARNFRNFLTDDTIDQHLSTVLISSKELIERNVAGHVCLSYFKHLYHCDMRNRAADELTAYLLDAVALRERASRLRSEIERLQGESKSAYMERVRISPTPTPVAPRDAEADGRPAFLPVGIIRRSASHGDVAGKHDRAQLLATLREKKDELQTVEAALRSTDLDDTELMSKLHLTVGEWVQELHKDNFWEMKHRSEILDHFEKAVDLTPTSSRAWHCWGLLNYRIAFRTETFVEDDQHENQPDKKTQERLKEKYLVESLRGFFKALEYLEDESFCVPNLLRILTIWFRYAQQDNIERSLKEGSRSIQVSIWIYVLPQLVARVSFPQQRVRALVEELLTYLGTEYPHHVVYPLTVCAFHGDTVARRRCAQAILDRLSHGEKEKMFTQAKTVSQGLIKTAISWAEYWSSGIEDAAKIYTDKGKSQCDEAGMRKILLDLYPMMEEDELTEAEEAFLREYKTDLETAKRYLQSDNLHQAWERYRKIWERIQDTIARNHTLQLVEVAPQLMDTEEEGFETAVPGVNPPGAGSTVLIHRFLNDVTVIQSKQKPKVVIIQGDDGVEYKFLLKGHEDIRQDERVMQLFGLINALFQHTDDLYHINIMTTPVVPLSDNVGLIGWLEKTETIYRMISDYRKDRNIPVNLECSFIVRMGQLKSLDYYYKLPPQKKVEILSACVERTPSDCLRRVFWTRTATSEIWLEYRTQYVKTLATMSMVGYILGLGDRHLNNIMLTNEGVIVHIDFGDCFEVALNRQRFPEQVPFRLTRLLVQALEASGTEGTFRYTSESVMRCLRKNRDSLTSLLETFVYDPLINWRLLETVAPEEAEAVQEREKERCEGVKESTLSQLDDVQHDPQNNRADDEASIPTQREFEEEKKAEQAGVDEMNIPEGEENNVVSEEDSNGDVNPLPEETLLPDGQNNHGLEIASALLARSAQIRNVGEAGPGDQQLMSANMSAYDKARSVKVHEGVTMREGWEGELVNEKAKKVVIRIREKLTGYDFPKTIGDSRQSVSPSPLDTGLFDTTQTSRSMMLGGGSYEGSWVMKNLVEDDECDIGVSVAHREMWWLNQNADGPGDASEEAGPVIERCTVQEQVQHLIVAATDVENLSKMFIGWCPFW